MKKGGIMKKYLRWLVVLCALATLVLGALVFTACGEDGDSTGKGGDNENCAHLMFTGEEITKQPTCTTKGEKKKVCAQCGKEILETIDELGHDPDYTVSGVSTATCEEAGYRAYPCRRCDYLKEDTKSPVAPLGHDYVLDEELSTATCDVAGTHVYSCSRCDATVTRETNKVLGHNYKIIRQDKQTCDDNTVEYSYQKCSRCDDEKQEKLAKLPHSMGNAVTTPAKCTTPGSTVKTCTVCNIKETLTLPAIGHDYQDKLTTKPTFTDSGWAQSICSRCGVIEVDESGEYKEHSVAPLEEGSPAEFDITLFRNSKLDSNYNGSAFITKYTLTIYLEDGKTVARLCDREGNDAGPAYFKDVSNLTSTTRTVMLAAHENWNYKVEISAVGFQTSTSEMNAASPEIEIYMSAAKITERDDIQYYYEGDVMSDFTLQVFNSEAAGAETVTLSELLATKKLVLINFFFVGCTYCDLEFPPMVDAYNNYKDDVAIIAVATYNHQYNTSSRLKKYPENLKLPNNEFPFYIILEEGQKVAYGTNGRYLSQQFNITGSQLGGGRAWPTTAYIDSEGVIMKIQPGAPSADEAACREHFYSVFESFKKGENWVEGREPQSNALETAMLRGDYMLPDEQ